MLCLFLSFLPLVCLVSAVVFYLRKMSVMSVKSKCEMMWSAGFGRKPQDGKNITQGDLHFWIRDKDGNIIDPTPCDYDGKKHYRPFKEAEQRKWLMFWWNMWKNHPNKQIMKATLYENPEERRCMYNCFAYLRHHKDCKIVVGSLGYELSKRRIFWEFG